MKTPRKVRAALLPPAEKALGLCLGPCSARHYIALEELGSPVVGAAENRRKTTYGDYATAALLLSLAPREAAALAADRAALAARVEPLLDAATIPDLAKAANAVLRRIRAALGLEDLPAQPPPKPGGTQADAPPDPT